MIILIITGIYCGKTAPLLTFRTEKFDRTFVHSAADPDISAELSISYPVFSGSRPDVVDSITVAVNKYILNPVAGSERAESTDSLWYIFRSSYKKIRRDFPEYRTAWKISREMQVYGLQIDFICLKFKATEFTGSAHPNSFIFFEIHSLHDGHTLKLKDFIKPEKIKVFRHRVEEKFREVRGVTSVFDLSDSGFQFPGNKFYVPENFGINDSVITFRFNSYDIGPYVLGPTDMNLPLEDLADLLK